MDAALARGVSVRAEAVPGAGKTRLLVGACVPGSLILSYNAQLAAATVPPEGSACLTFHALCSRCLALARDDAQMEDAVRRAEAGELEPHDVPPVRRLLVDEAQDVRPLYVRLLRILVPDDVPMLVVGDRHQLVYDFSARYPPSLDMLLRPETLFPTRSWAPPVALHGSHRLTPPVARLVNAVFDTDIVALRGDADAPKVEVRAPKSTFGLHAALRDVFHETRHETVLVLVDRKRGNRPLRALLNALSKEDGRRVFVHGVDTGGSSSCTTRCLTYWAAKGLECDTAIVLVSGVVARNPLYVGLTRTRRRLVVVLDPKAPHPALCRAIVAHGLDTYDVTGMAAVKALQEGSKALVCWDPPSRQEERNLDFWVPETLPEGTAVRVVEEETCRSVSDQEDTVAPFVRVRTCLVAAEHRATGVVRAMEDVIHPTRLDPGQRDAAVRAGFSGRAVSRYVSDEDLLAADLRRVSVEAYARMRGLEDAAEVALAVTAWDGFDHVMRFSRPVHPWAHPLGDAVRQACERLQGEFDVRLTDGERHVRVHASSPHTCYHCVWNEEPWYEAAVRASLHPAKKCTVLDLATHRVTEVTVPSHLGGRG